MCADTARIGQRLATLGVLAAVCFPSRAAAQLNWRDAAAEPKQVVSQPLRVAQLSNPSSSTTTQVSSAPPRRIRVFPRSNVRWQARWFPSEDGRDRIAVIDSGVNIVIDQVAGFDTVDIATDRLVIWTSADQMPDFQGVSTQTGEAPLEFYMEGNIVFRQQDRVIYAERMYYNVREQNGVVLDGELLTPIPGYEGLVRLKADVLRQVDPFRIEGYQAR